MRLPADKVRSSSAHALSIGIVAAAAAAFARSSKSGRRGRDAGQRTRAPQPTEDKRTTKEEQKKPDPKFLGKG